MAARTSITPTPADSRLTRDRLVGAAAIAFAGLYVAENVIFAATGALGYDAPIASVLDYYAANPVPLGIISGLVAAYLPLFLVFVTGLHGIVQRHGGTGVDWSRLASGAGAAFAVVFVLFNVLQIGLVLSAGVLPEATPAFQIVWQAHAAAFALALPMLGTTVIGAALATHASGMTPAWQRVLGVVSGSLLLAAGVGSLPVADGSPLIFVGLLGFAAALVWFVVTGIRLVCGTALAPVGGRS